MQINFQAGVEDIYDACVAKGSTPSSTSLSDVVAGIMAIPTGITPSGTLSITTNGTKDVTNYASANVQVPASAVVSGTKSITANGTYDITSYQKVTVSVTKSKTYYLCTNTAYNFCGVSTKNTTMGSEMFVTKDNSPAGGKAFTITL